MAKTAKLKTKPSSSSNSRSRASKRATSPSIDLDKSLKPTTTTAPRNHDDELLRQSKILAARTGAGVSKSRPKSKAHQKRGNAKTRGQKVRQERGLHRAEVVMDRFERKVEEARGRDGRRRERRRDWEEVNGEVESEIAIALVGKKAKTKGDGLVGEDEGEDWEDVNGDEAMGGADNIDVPAEGAVMAAESTEPVLEDGEKLGVMDVEHNTSLNGEVVEDEVDKIT